MLATEIPGWLSIHEGKALTQLAADKTVLEVGAWLGLSTSWLALSAKQVWSVDHHAGSPEHRGDAPDFPGLIDPQTGEPSTLRRFRSNLDELNLLHKVVTVVDSFEVVAPFLRPEFEMVFIDANHDHDSVVLHGRLAAQWCARQGAPIVFHDYGGWPGVTSGVAELQRRWKAHFEIVPQTTLAILRRT